jgi:hypothetical protein
MSTSDHRTPPTAESGPDLAGTTEMLERDFGPYRMDVVDGLQDQLVRQRIGTELG